MVLRESQQILPGAQNSSQVQSARSGFKSPDFTKEQPSATDSLLETIVGVGSKLASTAWDVAKEEAYLQGVSQVNKIESEAQLESSPITADWTKAGYRDTSGRLKLAEQNSSIAADMQEMRKKSPEEFQKYMQQKRAEITPQLEGMSRESRTSLFGQLVQSEVDAAKVHTSEHAKYIIETKQQAVQANMTQQRNQLAAHFNDPILYPQVVKSTVASGHAMIWEDPTLPESVKLSMTAEMAQYALSGNHVQLYKAMQNTKYTQPDGSEKSMIDRLPFKEQIKLDKQFREAESRVMPQKSAEWQNNSAKYDVLLQEDPATVSYDDYNQHLMQGLQEFGISGEQYGSKMEKWYSAQYGLQEQSGLATAFSTGDYNYMRSNGGEQKAKDTWLKLHSKEDLPSLVSKSSSIAINTGSPVAASLVGELVAPAIQQTMASETITEDAAAGVRTMLNLRTNLSGSGKPAAALALTEGLDDKTLTFLYALEDNPSGSLEEQIAAAKKQIDNNSKGGAIQKQFASESTRDGFKAVQAMEPTDLSDSLGLGLKALVGSEAQIEQQLQVRDYWFENSANAEASLANVKYEFMGEYERTARAHPMLKAEQKVEMSKRNLSKRVLPSVGGPVILPPGVGANQYFKAPAAANPAQIGKALDDLYLPEDGSRVLYQVTPSGFIGKHYNDRGEMLPDIRIDPAAVGEKVRESMARHMEERAKIDGPGETINGVTFNGDNSAGVSNRVAYLFRNKLLEHEGVRTDAYTDGNGTSFGVGISSTGDFFEKPAGPNGEYTKAQIDGSFMAASNQALKLANGLTTAVLQGQNVRQSARQNKGDAVALLLADVAYQNQADARAVATALRMDPDKAELVLQATAGYKAAGAERQQWRMNQLKLAMSIQ